MALPLQYTLDASQPRAGRSREGAGGEAVAPGGSGPARGREDTGRG